MTTDRGEAFGFDEERPLALSDLADLSGLSEAEVLELVDYGALSPADATAGQCVFTVRSVTVARAAHRLREDFELAPDGVALLLSCLDRIRDLEEQLRALRARLPRSAGTGAAGVGG